MRFFGVALAVFASAASAEQWWFDAWDGLSCGDAPQNGVVFSTTEGSGEKLCVTFEHGQRAYSYASGFPTDEIQVRGFLHEHCEGPNRTVVPNTCTNPQIEIPYIRSWQIDSVL